MVQDQRKAGRGSGRADAQRELRRAFGRFLESALVVGSATVGQNLALGSSGLEWVTPAPPAPTGAVMKAVTVTVPYGALEHTEVIADPDVLTTSMLTAAWGSCTDSDENGPAGGDVALIAAPAAVNGSLNLTIFAVGHGVLGGPYKLAYLIGAP